MNKRIIVTLESVHFRSTTREHVTSRSQVFDTVEEAADTLLLSKTNPTVWKFTSTTETVVDIVQEPARPTLAVDNVHVGEFGSPKSGMIPS